MIDANNQPDDELLRRAQAAKSPIELLPEEEIAAHRGKIVAIIKTSPTEAKIIASADPNPENPSEHRIKIRHQVAKSYYSGRNYQLRHILNEDELEASRSVVES